MAKKEKSLVWMIAKPFIGLCLPILISVGVMHSMSGGSFSFSGLMPDFMKPYVNDVGNAVEGMTTSAPQQVYKWKDAEGVWHFSETAPSETSTKQFESFTVSSDITVIQMPKPTPVAEKERRGSQGFVIGQESKEKGKKPGDLASSPMELLEQAKQISEQSKQRNKMLEGM